MDGLWTIKFNVPGRLSAMVLTFNGNRITGGNNSYYYTGAMQANGDTMNGQVTGIHYFGDTDPLFGGAKSIPVQFSAKLVNGNLQGTAKAGGMPASIPFTGQKVA